MQTSESIQATSQQPLPVLPDKDSLIVPDTSRNWFARVWPMLGRHKILLPLVVIGALLSISIQASNPALLGFGIDSLSSDDPWKLSPWFYAALLLSLGLTRALIYIAYRWGMARLMYQMEADLRATFFNHSTLLGLSFFDKLQTGQLVSRANADIRALQMFLAFSPFMFITLISFFAALGYMIYTDYILTLLAVFALPGVYLLGMRLRKILFPLNWINQQRQADLTAIVDENINGLRIVRSFAAEKSQIDKLAYAAQKLKWSSNQLVDANAKFGPTMENLPRLGVAAVLFYGGILVIEGKIGLGSLLAFNLYMMQLVTPFRMIGTFLIMERRAAASAQRIFEVLDETPEIQNKTNAKTLEKCQGLIEFNNVSFTYRTLPKTIPKTIPKTQSPKAATEKNESINIKAHNTKVLDHLSFTIKPGERVALVGRTGSGKSTIAKLLTRLYECEGEILVDHISIKDVTLESLRSNIAIAHDEAFLFSSTIKDNITFANPAATEQEMIAAAKSAQAHDFICKLPDGYNTIVGERGYTLSGGQRQRVALARIFLSQAPILILDDATSAIDVKTEAKIHSALTQAMKNRSTLIITHRLSTIALADRILLIEDGKISANGTHEELAKTNKAYQEILSHERRSQNANQTVEDDSL